MSKNILSVFLKLVFITVFIFNGFVFGQEVQVSEVKSDSVQRILRLLEDDLPIGKININQEARLDSLLRKHIGYNDSVGIQGWKILIFRGRNLKKAQDAGALFNSLFPDLELTAFVDYQAPDFQTLVGAFRTREEAYRSHQQIKSEFEFSYLVHTQIKSGEMK